MYSLTDRSWEINGESLTAWIDADRLFEIRPGHLFRGCDVPLDSVVLTIDDLRDASSQLIGWYEWITEAQAAAEEYLEEICSD